MLGTKNCVKEGMNFLNANKSICSIHDTLKAFTRLTKNELALVFKEFLF